MFKRLKEIPMADVVGMLGLETKMDKVCCPFHYEKTPSMHIFNDGFKCFGCGEYGDAVDLVARIRGVAPYDAAQELARYFNLPLEYRPPVRTSKQTRLTAEKRQVIEELRAKEDRTFHNLAALHRVFYRYDDGLAKAFQMHFEHQLNTLRDGAREEKRQLIEEWGDF